MVQLHMRKVRAEVSQVPRKDEKGGRTFLLKGMQIPKLEAINRAEGSTQHDQNRKAGEQQSTLHTRSDMHLHIRRDERPMSALRFLFA